jgi:glyoxylase-like metal-dependent hydrolase (beta-lactamase superfamily II)
MSLGRRRFLVGVATVATGVASRVISQGTGAASEARAPAPQATDPPPSVHRFRLGAMTVTIVNDGRFALPAHILTPDVESEERERYFGARHLPVDAIPLQLCPVLIDTGNERILVDTGMGTPSEVAPDSGWLTRKFSATGTTPESIDVVVLTHGHEDHYGGLVDPATGKSRFPNAKVVISRAELDFWRDPDVSSRDADLAEAYGGIEAFEAFIAKTAAMLDAVRDRLQPMEPGEEIASRIHIVDSAGHTAGHIGLLLQSENEKLLLVGDAITNVHAAFEHPGWRFLYDDYGEQAIRTRLQLLERAASEGLLMSGYHFPYPAVGRVFRYGGGYRWLPEVMGWSGFGSDRDYCCKQNPHRQVKNRA